MRQKRESHQKEEFQMFQSSTLSTRVPFWIIACPALCNAPSFDHTRDPIASKYNLNPPTWRVGVMSCDTKVINSNHPPPQNHWEQRLINLPRAQMEGRLLRISRPMAPRISGWK